jgi:hypothetical protein
MFGWVSKVYDKNLFQQSGQLSGEYLPRSEQAWRLFCSLPIHYLKNPMGKTDAEGFNSLTAWLMYHWEAGHAGGLSLASALCGSYNAGFTLLRSFLELVLNGALFQCLASETYRNNPSPNLEHTDALRILVSNSSSLIEHKGQDPDELKHKSLAIFDVLRGDWTQSAFRLPPRSIVQQLADWQILEGLPNSIRMVRELYDSLSRNVHERIEFTDIGRAVEEGAEIFEWPPPILHESIDEFLHQFHTTMDIGAVVLLNMLPVTISLEQIKAKSQQLLKDASFQTANLKYAGRIVKKWAES